MGQLSCSALIHATSHDLGSHPLGGQCPNIDNVTHIYNITWIHVVRVWPQDKTYIDEKDEMYNS